MLAEVISTHGSIWASRKRAVEFVDTVASEGGMLVAAALSRISRRPDEVRAVVALLT